MAESKEAQAVKKAMGITDKPGSETQPAGNEQNQENGKTVEGKPGNEKDPTKQREVSQPKTFKVGKKEQAPPAKKEVVAPSKEELAKQQREKEALEQFETRYSSTVNERFGATPERIKEVLTKFPQLEEQLKADPYKDPFTKSLDDLIAKGVDVDTAIRFLRADPTKMSPREKLLFKMQLETGLSVDKLNRQIDRKYHLNEFAPRKKDGDNKDTEEPDNTLGLEDLEYDTAPINKEFDTLRNKVLEGGKSRQQVESAQKELERVTSWAPVAESLVDDFTTLEVEMPNKNKLQFSIEMDADEKALYLKDIASSIKTNPALMADDKGKAAIKAALQGLYIVRNWAKMAVTFAEQGRSMADKEWTDLVHNPSLANTTGKEHDFNQNKGNKDDAIVEFISKRESGRQRRKK